MTLIKRIENWTFKIRNFTLKSWIKVNNQQRERIKYWKKKEIESRKKIKELTKKINEV